MIKKSGGVLGVVIGLLLAASGGRAYVLEGQSWTRDRTVQMQLSLGPSRPLSDGFQSFNESARDALNTWNGYLAHMKFSWVMNSPVVPANDDDEMSVFFSDTTFGESFGSSTLAITLLNYRDTVMEETDTIFNTSYTWDSYRGPLQPGIIDFHRVALHEFGHTVGLDHPDQANPKQTVTAVMNANVSNVDSLQADDIAGGQSIYSSGPAYQTGNNAPVLLNISTRAVIGTGDNVLIGGFIIQGSQPATLVLRGLGGSLRASGLTGVLDDPTITIYDSNNNIVGTNDDWFNSASGSTIASYHLDPPNSIDSAAYITLNPGSYTAIVQSYSTSTQPAGSGIGLVEVYDLHGTSSRLGNLSTRGQVQTGDGILIGGFIVGGATTKSAALRALGEALEHDAFARERLPVYIGRDDYFHALDAFARTPADAPGTIAVCWRASSPGCRC